VAGFGVDEVFEFAPVEEDASAFSALMPLRSWEVMWPFHFGQFRASGAVMTCFLSDVGVGG